MKPVIVILLAGSGMLMGAAAVSKVVQGDGASASANADVQQYLTTEIRAAQLDRTIHAMGTLRAEQTVDVSSQLSGQILKVHADFNDQVEAGQALAELDRRTFQARVQQAEAELQMAQHQRVLTQHRLNHARDQEKQARVQRKVFQAQIDRSLSAYQVARKQKQSFERLRQTGSVSDFEADDVLARFELATADLHEAKALAEAHEYALVARQTALLEAESELASANASIPHKEAALTLVKLDLERSVIRSPIQGLLIARQIEPGQTVVASLDAPVLFQIANDLDQMEIYAQIDETDIGFVQVGQIAEFSVDAFSGRSFSAVVREIRKSARVEQGVVLYTVVLRVGNPDKQLLPGMTTSIKIVIDSEQSNQVIPLSAVHFRPDEVGVVKSAPWPRATKASTQVWVLDADQVLRARSVQLGMDDGRFVAVKSGELRPDDRVVLGLSQQRSNQWFGLSF